MPEDAQNGQNDAGGAQTGADAGAGAAQKGLQAAKDGAHIAKDAGRIAASGGADVGAWVGLGKRILKYIVPLIAGILVMSIVITAAFFMMVVSLFVQEEEASANACTNGGSTSMSIIPTNGIVNIGYKTTHPVYGGEWEMTSDKMAVAQTIVKVGLNYTVGGQPAPIRDDGITIAIAVALVEQQLKNEPYGHGTSVGAFQLIDDHEPPINRMDVNQTAKWFYDGLNALPKSKYNKISATDKGKPYWEIPPGNAAQYVQRSAHPDRYAKAMGLAASISKTILDAMRAGNPAAPPVASPPNTNATETTTPTTTPTPPTSVYILGDSITNQVTTKYKELFSGRGITATISAVGGRSWNYKGNPSISTGTTGTGKQAVETDKAIIASSGAIIVALGTNGGLGANPPDEILTTFRSHNPNAKIYWVNIAGSHGNVAPYVVPFNNKLKELQTAGQITVIDWAAAVHPGGDGTQDPNGLLSDGIHPNAVGITKLVEVVGSGYQESNAPGCEGYAGTGGDPSACPPDSAFNAKTYRFKDGSSPHELCVKSVQQARSPEAGKAIIWAFNHVGIPYGQGPNGSYCNNTPTRTGPSHYDCSGFVSSAYEDTGTKVGGKQNTTGLRASSYTYAITMAQAKPGDLHFPHSGHVAMILADGKIVHTNTCGDVSHITTLRKSTYAVLAIRTASAPGP